MPIAIDGSRVPEIKKTMPCGGTPLWHYESGCAYYCDTCLAVIGSASQPARCVKKNREALQENSDD
jgi:hypothetical protein